MAISPIQLKFPDVRLDDGDRVEGYLPSRTLDDVWYPFWYVPSTGEFYCGCKGFSFRDKCGHFASLKFLSQKPPKRSKHKKVGGSSGVQDTSLWAYNDIKSRLAPLYAKIIDSFTEYPVQSNNQIEKNTETVINVVCPRVKELRGESKDIPFDPPILVFAGRAPVGHKGRSVMTWRLNSDLPWTHSF